ncbi:MAG: AAA family ATPase [Candidatus Pacebacteria bacterium]|nr:AAA family ATPase [Candidatus Paceibacterota bacterium]
MDKKSPLNSLRDSPALRGILEPKRRLESRGHLMIETIEIKNFRGFRKLTLSGLGRVNIVVGDNGAGKTALLESLFLVAAPSPEVSIRLRTWRSMEIGITVPGGLYDSIFHSLFRNRKIDDAVEIVTTGGDLDTRSLRIHYPDIQAVSVQLVADSASIQGQGYSPVTFTWTIHSGESKDVIPRIQGNTIDFGSGFSAGKNYEPNFLAAHAPLPTTQTANSFSEFSKIGKEARFVREIRKQIPEIRSLSVQTDAGLPVLWATLRDSRIKLPLNYVSEGITKIMTIFMSIAQSHDCIVLIDEIENGIHFSRQSTLWSQVRGMARSYNTQIFASTHSLECLRAAIPAITEFANDFRLIRMSPDRKEGSAIVVSGKDALSLIQTGLEIRK